MNKTCFASPQLICHKSKKCRNEKHTHTYRFWYSTVRYNLFTPFPKCFFLGVLSIPYGFFFARRPSCFAARKTPAKTERTLEKEIESSSKKKLPKILHFMITDKQFKTFSTTCLWKYPFAPGACHVHTTIFYFLWQCLSTSLFFPLLPRRNGTEKWIDWLSSRMRIFRVQETHSCHTPRVVNLLSYENVDKFIFCLGVFGEVTRFWILYRHSHYFIVKNFDFSRSNFFPLVRVIVVVVYNFWVRQCDNFCIRCFFFSPPSSHWHFWFMK